VRRDWGSWAGSAWRREKSSSPSRPHNEHKKHEGDEGRLLTEVQGGRARNNRCTLRQEFQTGYKEKLSL